jgi:hypothetical protein
VRSEMHDEVGNSVNSAEWIGKVGCTTGYRVHTGFLTHVTVCQCAVPTYVWRTGAHHDTSRLRVEPSASRYKPHVLLLQPAYLPTDNIKMDFRDAVRIACSCV